MAIDQKETLENVIPNERIHMGIVYRAESE